MVEYRPDFVGSIRLTLLSHHNLLSHFSHIFSTRFLWNLPAFPLSRRPLPAMQMYCQSPNYAVCPNNPVYPPDHSSPPPALPITPHTPRSVNFLPQLGQVYADNFFVPNPPPSSPPSSSSGTVSSRDSSPYPSPVERFVGDDYPYPYVPFVEPQQYVFHPLNPIAIETRLIWYIQDLNHSSLPRG